jgi:hypothetical protein
MSVPSKVGNKDSVAIVAQRLLNRPIEFILVEFILLDHLRFTLQPESLCTTGAVVSSLEAVSVKAGLSRGCEDGSTTSKQDLWG